MSDKIIMKSYKYLIFFLYINGNDIEAGNLEIDRDAPLNNFLAFRNIKTEVAKMLKKSREQQVDPNQVSIVSTIKLEQ